MRRRGRGLRDVKSDPSLPSWKGNRLLNGQRLKTSHSTRGTVFGGVTNFKMGVPLTHGSCLFLPSAQGCFCSHSRDLSLHCPQDDSTGEILFDEVFHALSRCLGGLLRPFRVPGSCIDFQPEIYITIQAYSSIIGLQAHQVSHPFSKFVPSDLISGSPLTKSLFCLYCLFSKSQPVYQSSLSLSPLEKDPFLSS